MSEWLVLTRGDVIREGDEERPSDFGLRWYPVYASRIGSPVESYPEYTFRRPRSTLIRDAAIDLLRWYLYAGASGITSSKFEKLKAAVGLTDEELRKKGE